MRTVQNNNDISAEVKQIFNTPPSWAVRYGATIILTTLFILILCSYFIIYRESIKTNIIITNISPYINIHVPENKKIENYLINNGDTIYAGQYIGIINSCAKWQDILKIESYIKQTRFLPIELLVNHRWIYYNYNLGEIQGTWSLFSKACDQYKKYLDTKITTQIKNITYNSKQTNIKRIDTSIYHIHTTKTHNKDITHPLNTQNSDIQIKETIVRYYMQLCTDISDWKQKHILISPINGTIHFNQSQYEKQSNNIKNTSFIIKYINKNIKNCFLYMDPIDTNKISINQKINIFFNDSSHENSPIEGYIYHMPTTTNSYNKFESDIKHLLPIEIIFSDNTTITTEENKPVMRSAEIIIAEHRILLLLIAPILSLF